MVDPRDLELPEIERPVLTLGKSADLRHRYQALIESWGPVYDEFEHLYAAAGRTAGLQTLEVVLVDNGDRRLIGKLSVQARDAHPPKYLAQNILIDGDKSTDLEDIDEEFGAPLPYKSTDSVTVLETFKRMSAITDSEVKGLEWARHRALRLARLLGEALRDNRLDPDLAPQANAYFQALKKRHRSVKF